MIRGQYSGVENGRLLHLPQPSGLAKFRIPGDLWCLQDSELGQPFLVAEPLHLTPPEAARSCRDSTEVLHLLYPQHHFVTYTHSAFPLPCPRIPPKQICFENQGEKVIESLVNWTFDEGKPEFLKRKQSTKKCKAATPNSTGFT